MTQYAKPTATKNNGGAWSGNVNGGSLHLDIDEGVASTDDFTSYAAASGQANGADTAPVVVHITSVTTPADGTCDFRVRTYASEDTTYTHELRQGYVDESTKGTLLATMSQHHTGGGVWQTKEDASAAFSGCTDGSDLYYRCIGHNNSGSFETVAITAMDVDLPDGDTTRNLSGTPDLLATTPMTGSGTLSASWTFTDGTPALTVITGSGTITVTQGSHTLTDGAPSLPTITGTGTLKATWQLSGAPELTPITATGTGTVQNPPANLSGDLNLLPLFSFSGLAAPIIKREFSDIRGAADLAQEYITSLANGAETTFIIFRDFLHVTGGPSGSKYTIFYIVKPEVPHKALTLAGLVIARQIVALRVTLDEAGTVYNRDNPGDPYTFVQPEQDLSPKRPCPAADPVNADGVRTERVSYYSRELKVIHE
jgi:hypothetical protein